MHVVDRKRKIRGTGGADKVAIHGALERGGPVVATVIETVSAKTVQASIRAWVESGATVYTDQASAYIGLNRDYGHFSVNHGTGEYVNGDVHTWTKGRSLSTTVT